MANVINVLPFGACLLHLPLAHLVRTNPAAGVGFAKVANQRLPVAFSFGEAYQLIDLLHGHIELPQELCTMTRIPPSFQAVPSARTFDGVDVVLIEPATPLEVYFRSYCLNRSGIVLDVTRPIGAVSQHALKRTNAWFNQGLFAMNERIQLEVAEELIALMPPDMPNPELAKAVLREARARPRDVRKGFRQFLELVRPLPVGVVIYVFRYFPDGRTISMPNGYREELIDVSNELGLRFFDPVALVREHGPMNVLREDMSHYKDEFMPVVGAALAEFIQSIHERS